MNRRRLSASLLPMFAAVGALAFAPVASALEIHLNFSGRAAELADLRNAFLAGANLWQAALADPVEVTIDVRFDEELGLFVAAGATPALWEVPYVDLQAALAADARSALDAMATAHLPPGPTLAFRTFALDESPATNAGNDPINTLVGLTTANAVALGLPVAAVGVNEIGLNEFFYDSGVFDVDPADGVDGIDLVGTAAHEIGHVLGFLSGVDGIDLVFARDELPPELAELIPGPEELNEYSALTPLDLFRFSAASMGLIDMTPGTDAFFSIDGGVTPVGNLATGAFHGDGVQAGHWRGEANVMSGELAPNTVYALSPRDLAALDAIGWDVHAVPEPNGVSLLLLFALPLLRKKMRP